jgi:hypothetical protein
MNINFKRQICFLFLSALISISVVYSQSEFIQRGESSFGGGFGFCTSKEAGGFNLFASYSHQGFLDGKLTYSKLNGGHIQGGVFTPSGTYYLLKQEDADRIPTLGLSLGFSHYKYKQTRTFIEPDTITITWKSYQKVEESIINALLLGVNAQKRIWFWRALSFQPILGAGLAVKNSGWEFSIHGGVAIYTRMVTGPMLILTPGIERQSGITTFLITLSAMR